jgi:hypothetical protein
MRPAATTIASRIQAAYIITATLSIENPASTVTARAAAAARLPMSRLNPAMMIVRMMRREIASVRDSSGGSAVMAG